MNRKEAEKLADKIFDMIDRNYPRGLIKSDLVDLIAGFKWEDDLATDDWVPLIDLIEEAKKALSATPGHTYISTTRTAPKIYGGFSGGDLCTDQDLLDSLKEVRKLFAKDPCGND